MNDLVEITPQGKLRLHFHDGQWRAWNSERRFVTVLAGTQSGKTSFGPHWLNREIKTRGPGDYMVVTPTYPLLELKALPEFRRLFEDWLALGTYTSHPVRQFRFSQRGQQRTFGDHGIDYRTNVFFGYAADPDSLESATAKAVWADEAGQKRFKLGSWQAILRRLSLHRGRALITTTPYALNWLKTELHDRWKAGDPDIDVIRFESIANPRFDREEFEDAKRRLPKWKFDLFYRAIFTRPAGVIYDAFDEEVCKSPRIPLPDHWQRYVGLDFGGLNTAAVFFAEEPMTGNYYLYRTYKAGGRTAAGHVDELLSGEPMIPLAVGGSPSEQQWRDEFKAAGLPVRAPDISDVELGIDRVYGMHKANRIYVFEDLDDYLEEKLTYARELDESDQPTEKIEDKETFHLMDAERYIMGWINRKGTAMKSAQVDFYGQNQPGDAPIPVRTMAEVEKMLNAYDEEHI